jgi:metal-responsive CopG/Arc/MetJ family transcriptional regulator|tara:strand:+ start:472 stop:789 length:318 start_codon:yes stop_codon:yes gene_type:complete
MQTKQVNIRVPTDLLDDLDIVSKLLKVNKSEWIKTKLAEDIHKEKNQLLLELSNLYTKGIISKKEVQNLVGSEIANQMESIHKTAKRSVKAGIEYGKQLKKAISG